MGTEEYYCPTCFKSFLTREKADNCIFCNREKSEMETVTIKCCACGKPFNTVQEATNCGLSHQPKVGAKRNPVECRYDLLIPEFLQEMAKLAGIGAKKYGDRNWQQSRLEGDKSPLNHGIDHILRYQKGVPSDVLDGKEGQLVSCAFG